MKLSHYKELDGIRAIAALMVIVFHFFNNYAFAGNVSTSQLLSKQL